MSNFKSLKRWIALAICLLLTLQMVLPATALGDVDDGADSPDGVVSSERELDAIQKEYLGTEINPDEEVRVSIVLESASTLEAGYSTINIVNNKSAMSYRDSLRMEQAAVQTAIEHKLGKELDVVWNLTLAANIISVNVRRGDIDAIKAVDGVKSVYVEKQYSPDVVSVGGTADPNMAIAGMIDGAQDTWLEEGYTGEGTLIAIIDTGLDINHQSFDNDAFLHAVSEENLALDEETVKSLAGELNAVKSEKATADQLYRSEKVPFGWNYIDSSADITHDNDTQGEHGSHVAGIAAANRYVDTDGDGEYEEALKAVQVAGNAPDAQLLIMKVFGKAGGAYDSDCAAAIEDAITLGADAVNLSLGTALPGFASPQDGDPYAKIQELLVGNDTVVVFSAGNAGSWAENTYNGYLYNDGVSYQFDGESGSYTNAFTVASVENGGFIGASFEVDGVEYGMTETSGYGNPPFGATLDPDGTGTTYKFVMVEFAGAGKDDEFLAALPEGTIDENTIYITWRGTTSFYQKGNAGYEAGAAAVIVGNNQAGSINMDLTGYEGDIPVVSILQDYANAIWDSVTEKNTAGSYQYITGSLTVNGATAAHENSLGYYTMSSFSSWGTTGDLALKPEISAFGGSIYSVWGSNKSDDSYQTGHDQYELMSGTSMAAPQITGMSALVQQYLRDKDYDLGDLTTRAVTQSLLMATAEPMKEAGKTYYSLLQQGAGLANVKNAVTSPIYITVDGQNDGKVKAELGDDYKRTGEYEVEFDIHNLTGEYYTYELDLDAFTQAYLEDGSDKFLDYSTRDLKIDATYEIDGELLAGTRPDLRYDFDDDGDIDEDDAQLLLDYIIKGTELPANEENADVNGDGDVDTYDVHVLLNTDLPDINIGADTVHVKVTFTLTDEEKKTLEEQNPAGAYIEAFLFVKPVADEEGVLLPELSIPVLAYYGSWTDASMFEVGTGEEWYETNSSSRTVGGRYPYTFQGAGASTYNLTMTNVLYQGTAAVSLSKSNVLINGSDAGNMSSVAYRFSPIRNYDNGVVQVTDSTGKVLWRSSDFGRGYGLLYYENAGCWCRADYNTGYLYYNLYEDVTVDWATAMKNITPGVDEVTVSLILAPEYYAQYDYDWDILTDGNIENGELGKGAILSTTLKLDLEPPEIVDINVIETGDPKTRTIEVKLTDNKALSIARLYDESGNSQNFTAAVRNTGYESKAASGTEYTVTFDGGDVKFGTFVTSYGYLYDAIYRLEVEDTAGNVTTKRFEVGDVKFTEVPTKVTPSETSIEIMKGATYSLSAEVDPYNLTDEAKAVTWSSKNPEIATVDENGVVTGVNKGNATIVVSTVNNGADGNPVTAEVTVEVFTLPIIATGILGDENGYAKFFEWDFEEGVLAYDKAEESEVVYPLALTTYKKDTFLAVDGDGTIYELNADGTEVQSSAYAYDGLIPYDMSYSDNAGFWWTLQNYIMQEDDPFNPEMMGFNMAQYSGTYGNVYATAVIDEDWTYSDGSSGNYLLYALTDKGYIYKFMVDDATGSANISVYNLASLGMNWAYEGYLGDTYGNMVIGGDGAFYISIMRNNTNELYRVVLTQAAGSTSFSLDGIYLGNFGDGVWPGLLLTVENKPTGILYDFNNDGVIDELDAQALLRAVVRDDATDDMDVNNDGRVTTRDVYELLVKINAGEFNSVKTSFTEQSVRIEKTIKAVKTNLQTNKFVGSLNSVGSSDAKVDTTKHTAVVPITASDVNNGLFVLTYDNSVLTYSGNKTPSSALTNVYNSNDGIRIGFAGLETLDADTVVAEITFTYAPDYEENRDTTVKLSVLEEDDDYYGEEDARTEDIPVGLPMDERVVLDLTFDGIVWDDDGIWWSEITTINGPQYEPLTNKSAHQDGTYFVTAAIDLWSGTLFAATEEDDYSSILYEVDPKTFKSKEVGPGTLSYSDMADAMGLNYESGESYVLGVYGQYVVLIDTATGEYESAIWSTATKGDGANLVGIAWCGLTQYTSGRTSYYCDCYYMVDENGKLYLIAFLYMGGDFYYLTFSDTGDDCVLLDTGYETDTPYYQSLYYIFGDEDTDTPGYIVWARLSYADDVIDFVVIDEDTNDVYNLGSFEEGVWPVGGLVTLDDAENSVNSVVTKGEIDSTTKGEIDSITKADLDMEIAPVAQSKTDTDAALVPMTLTGDLNSVDVPETSDATDEYPKTTVTIPVYASASTNGEFTLSYDTDVLELADTDFGTMFTSYEVEDGLIHVGYADRDAINANVINATFNVIDPDATSTDVTLTVVQDGLDKTENMTEYEIELNHEWNTDPTFDWSEDGKSATATFTCAIDETHTKTVEATVTGEVKNEATCAKDGTTTYTATVEFEGETYTDTKDVKDIPATGHSYGEPEISWSEDGKSATATFTCEIDGHTETVEATVESEVKVEATETEDGTTLYTATVKFNGETYTFTLELQDIPATGSTDEPGTPDGNDSLGTGDSNNIAYWAAMILLALFALCAIAEIHRKVFDEGR